MKILLIGLLLTSAAAQAVDPRLDPIIKKYAPTLFDIKVGQSWTTLIHDEEIEGSHTTVIDLVESSVVLKIVGNKYYQLTQSRNSQTQEVSSRVVLESIYRGDEETDDIKLDLITVENDFLTVSSVLKTQQAEASLFSRKNLLTPIMCDTMTLEKVKSATFEAVSSHTSNCGPILSKDKIKLIDLTQVEFCDGNDECEIRDMSYLTSEL